MRAAKLSHLRTETVDGDRKRGAIESALAESNNVSLSRRVKYDLDAFHGPILLKANYRVNCARKASGHTSNSNVGASLQPSRTRRIMGMKNYLH